jgi:hypothetical protein
LEESSRDASPSAHEAFLLPDVPAIRYPGLAVSFVAEVGLAPWHVVKGVKVVDSGASAST